MPNCRVATVCPTPPVPDASTNLQNSTSGSVNEFDFAEYECLPGAQLQGSDPR